MCRTILCSQHARTVKDRQRIRNQHSSFDGLIQEDIDLSDTYSAVLKNTKIWLKLLQTRLLILQFVSVEMSV